MKLRLITGKAAVVSVTGGALLSIGLLAGTAAAADTSAADSAASVIQPAATELYLGPVHTPSQYRVSVPAGTYVVRYSVEGVAALSTSVDGVWLGTLSVGAGTHDSASFRLTAGSHQLVLSFPDGYLDVYASLVQVG